MRLLLSQNDYEVKTLLRIGYAPHFIASLFIRYFSLVFACSLFAAFGIFFILKLWVNHTLQIGGIYLNESLSLISILIIPLSFVLFIAVGTISARKNVMKLFNK